MVKRTLKKAGSAQIDMAMALLVLRTTPIDSHLPSSAELLYARKLKANVPVRMTDNRTNRDDIRQRLIQRQQEQKSCHESRGTRPLSVLLPEQHVRVRGHVTGSWKPAIVTGACDDEPRSYNVQQHTGGILRRKRRHIQTIGKRHQIVNGRHDDQDEVSDQVRRDLPVYGR